MCLPFPLMPLAIKASRIADQEYIPAAISATETPTRPGASAEPVMDDIPVSA